MKKNLKKVVAAILGIVCLCLFAFPVSADGYLCKHGYRSYNDYKMFNGVGQYGNHRRYYWVHAGSVTSTYKGYVDNAVSQWVNTTSAIGVTTSISIRETTTKSSANFEFYDYYIDIGVGGKTEFYVNQRELFRNGAGTLTEHFGWSKMTFSSYELTRLGISAAQKQATIAHELGRGMGLTHQLTRPKSIMCQYASGRTATRADATDCKAINHLYG